MRRRRSRTDSPAAASFSELPVVTTEAELRAVIDVLDHEDVVAFDTEFHSERTYVPRLMLVQIATREQIWLIDPLGEADLRPLFAALSRPGLTVVGHALKNDLRIAWLVYGTTFDTVFDTQIAAAFLGHGLQVGLGHLIRSVLDIHLPKGEQMSDWSQRPLPDRLLGYAAGDVAHLLEVHDRLRGELEGLGRLSWVDEECRELTQPARYARDPELAFQRVAGGRRLEPREAGVLAALAAEREAMAAEEDVVPHFLLPDDVLLLLARHHPQHRRDLEADRRFNHRAIQRHAARWLDAVARGLERPLQRPPARPPPGPELEAVAALLMLLVSDIASRNNLAPQLLIKRDQMLDALRTPPTSAAAFAEAAQLTGWRAELLVDPLWLLLTERMRVTCAREGRAGVRMRFELVPETE